MTNKFTGKKFKELLDYVEYFSEDKKPDFLNNEDEVDETEEKVSKKSKKSKKENPFAKGKKKSIKSKKSKKGKIPPQLAKFIKKKKGSTNDSQDED